MSSPEDPPGGPADPADPERRDGGRRSPSSPAGEQPPGSGPHRSAGPGGGPPPPPTRSSPRPLPAAKTPPPPLGPAAAGRKSGPLGAVVRPTGATGPATPVPPPRPTGAAEGRQAAPRTGDGAPSGSIRRPLTGSGSGPAVAGGGAGRPPGARAPRRATSHRRPTRSPRTTAPPSLPRTPSSSSRRRPKARARRRRPGSRRRQAGRRRRGSAARRCRPRGARPPAASHGRPRCRGWAGVRPGRGPARPGRAGEGARPRAPIAPASQQPTAATLDGDILDARPVGPPPPAARAAAASPSDGPSVVVANVADGGFLYWLVRFYLFGLIAAIGLGACFAVGFYVYFAATLPPLPNLAAYRAQVATTTVVRAWDGTPLAEFATERRDFIPFEKIPKRLVQAFLAAEDRRFYEHGGLDYRGIARALGANLRAGEVAQGGSTITQQVAKSFLTSERTIQRKIREAILARRLESHLTKNEILTLYLNQIFLGAGAYGVGGGARRYFDKSVDELNVGEMATLAGLVRAPSRFSPLTNLDAGRARRDQVLSAMVAAGYLTDAEATTWKARPLVIRPRPDFFRMYAPYFTEHVRRDVARRYGDQQLWQECMRLGGPTASEAKDACAKAQRESDKKLAEAGYEIETTVVPWVDAAAQENVDFGLRKLDKRQGWRGPVARLAGPALAEFRRRAVARYGGDPPVEGELYLGLVESNAKEGARVRVGKNVYFLPSKEMDWAAPYDTKSAVNGRHVDVDAGRAAPRRRGLGEERPPLEAAPLLGLHLRREERGAVAACLRRGQAARPRPRW